MIITALIYRRFTVDWSSINALNDTKSMVTNWTVYFAMIKFRSKIPVKSSANFGKRILEFFPKFWNFLLQALIIDDQLWSSFINYDHRSSMMIELVTVAAKI